MASSVVSLSCTFGLFIELLPKRQSKRIDVGTYQQFSRNEQPIISFKLLNLWNTTAFSYFPHIFERGIYQELINAQ